MCGGPRHIHRRTPLLGHTTLKHTGASPLPPLDSSRIQVCFAVGVTWYHQAAPLTSPSSRRHRNLSCTTCTDTKLPETRLTTLAFTSPDRIGTSTRASTEKPLLDQTGSSTRASTSLPSPCHGAHSPPPYEHLRSPLAAFLAPRRATASWPSRSNQVHPATPMVPQAPLLGYC